MSEDGKVSPLPWEWLRSTDYPEISLNDKSGQDVLSIYCGKYPSAEDAAFIVRAVNSHAQMVAALEGLAWVLDKAESDASGTERWEYVSRRINSARAALAAAKGAA